MELKELFMKIKIDHENLMMVAIEKMIVKTCYRNYAFDYNGHHYRLRFNLITLDFFPLTKLPFGLRGKIKSEIIKGDYLKWKFKKEGRAFFDFLKLYYKHYDHIVFSDSESPDFIIHDDLQYGYEITEATDAHNAIFNETVYRLTGMANYSKEFKTYIHQINKVLTNKNLSHKAYRRIDERIIHKRILECIKNKVTKYQHYERVLDSRNIIIFNNRIGFRRKNDFEAISKGIKEMEIAESNVDRIFIISGTRDLMVEYDTNGRLVEIRRHR